MKKRTKNLNALPEQRRFEIWSVLSRPAWASREDVARVIDPDELASFSNVEVHPTKGFRLSRVGAAYRSLAVGHRAADERHEARMNVLRAERELLEQKLAVKRSGHSPERVVN